MNKIKTFEAQLLGWSKSTSKNGPKITFLLQDDAEIEYFEKFTLAKNKIAGQLFDVAVSISSEDDQAEPEARPEQEVKPKKVRALSQDAVMLCKNDAFQEWSKLILKEMNHAAHLSGGEDAAKECIYIKCGIKSRADLNHSDAAKTAFKNMHKSFGSWVNCMRKLKAEQRHQQRVQANEKNEPQKD